MWNTLFWRWISSKNRQKLKNVVQKNFPRGLITKLENLFVFGKNLWKISSNWWFQKSCWPISLRLKHWKSVIRETPNLSTDVDSSTDVFVSADATVGDALLPWDLLCSPGRITWEGDNIQTTHGRTSQLLDLIGPVGWFGENQVNSDRAVAVGWNNCELKPRAPPTVSALCYFFPQSFRIIGVVWYAVIQI